MPPAVRSVRLAGGWYHVAEPGAMERAVREQFVVGLDDPAEVDGLR